MKTRIPILSTVVLLLAFQSVAFSQSNSVTELFKKNFNQTVQEVQNTEDAIEKRVMLNEAFSKMTEAIDRIESRAHLSDEESAQLATYRSGIQEKISELNGTDGFDKVLDKDLNDFSDYSQQYFEQAARTVTIGLTAALLIILILILL